VCATLSLGAANRERVVDDDRRRLDGRSRRRVVAEDGEPGVEDETAAERTVLLEEEAEAAVL
jgi:hypothetical protein